MGGALVEGVDVLVVHHPRREHEVRATVGKNGGVFIVDEKYKCIKKFCWRRWFCRHKSLIRISAKRQRQLVTKGTIRRVCAAKVQSIRRNEF